MFFSTDLILLTVELLVSSKKHKINQTSVSYPRQRPHLTYQSVMGLNRRQPVGLSRTNSAGYRTSFESPLALPTLTEWGQSDCNSVLGAWATEPEYQSIVSCKHAHQNVMESPRAEGNGTAKFEISRALVFKFHTISKFTRLKYFTRAKIPTNLSTRSTFLVRTHCSKLNFRVITKAIIIILSSFLMFLAQFYSSPQLDY